MNTEVGRVKAIYLRELGARESRFLALGKKKEATFVTAEKKAWQEGKLVEMNLIRPKPLCRLSNYCRDQSGSIKSGLMGNSQIRGEWFSFPMGN